MLYTRTGDTGTTRIFGCDQRLSKTSAIAEALGALDEVNSHLGLCRAVVREQGLRVPAGKRVKRLDTLLREVQQVLFIVQAEIAGAPKRLGIAKVTVLERAIDTLEAAMPPLHSFSLAGGTCPSALLDVARTIARTAERRVVAVHEEGVRVVRPATLAYLNRLSSLLFALARYANHAALVSEEAPTYR